MRITRKLEFDAGHRIPDHSSKCRNCHGHRYVLHASFEGELVQEQGSSDTGMVVDFSVLKELLADTIDKRWDHGFLVYEGDELGLQAMSVFGSGHKTVLLSVIPTVENLVVQAAQMISMEMHRREITGFTLAHLVLYETPNCYAEWDSKTDGT